MKQYRRCCLPLLLCFSSIRNSEIWAVLSFRIFCSCLTKILLLCTGCVCTNNGIDSCLCAYLVFYAWCQSTWYILFYYIFFLITFTSQLNPFSTAVFFGGQTSQITSVLSQKRDSSSVRIDSYEVLPSAVSWTSRGHRCRPFCPPVPSILSRIGVQHSHCSSIFIEYCY